MSDMLTGVQAIAAYYGAQACALMKTSGVRCWSNTGATGLPTSDVLTGVQAIAVGDNYTCALMQIGGVRCWGNNGAGQLGQGDAGLSTQPTPVRVLGTCE
jgi:alpha-tubulin suppressor-like RCC1 family protein